MAGYYEPGSQYGDRPRQSQEQVQREPHLLNLKVCNAINVSNSDDRLEQLMVQLLSANAGTSSFQTLVHSVKGHLP